MSSQQIDNLVRSMFIEQPSRGFMYTVTVSGKYTIQFNSNGTYRFWSTYAFPSDFNLNTIDLSSFSVIRRYWIDGVIIQNANIDMRVFEGSWVINDNIITLNDSQGVRSWNINFSDDRNILILLRGDQAVYWLQKVNNHEAIGGNDTRDSRLILGAGYAWVNIHEGGFIFNADGTFLQIAEINGIWSVDFTGTWSTRGNKLTLTYDIDGISDTATYTVVTSTTLNFPGIAVFTRMAVTIP